MALFMSQQCHTDRLGDFPVCTPDAAHPGRLEVAPYIGLTSLWGDFKDDGRIRQLYFTRLDGERVGIL